MTTFKYGDKVLLPEWLGGGEATFKDDAARGSGRGQVALGLAVIFLPIIELTKAPTPEPIEIGSIHTDSKGVQYVLTDYNWAASGHWFRFTGGIPSNVGHTWFSWEEISN